MNEAQKTADAMVTCNVEQAQCIAKIINEVCRINRYDHRVKIPTTNVTLSIDWKTAFPNEGAVLNELFDDFQITMLTYTEDMLYVDLHRKAFENLVSVSKDNKVARIRYNIPAVALSLESLEKILEIVSKMATNIIVDASGGDKNEA